MFKKANLSNGSKDKGFVVVITVGPDAKIHFVWILVGLEGLGDAQNWVYNWHTCVTISQKIQELSQVKRHTRRPLRHIGPGRGVAGDGRQTVSGSQEHIGRAFRC